MEACISHTTALRLHRVPFAGTFLSDLLNTVAPIEVTVFKRSDRFARKGHRVHLCELELPWGALKQIQNHYCVSPEFMFLQLARTLDMHRLILLGTGLCAQPGGPNTRQITSVKRLRTFCHSVKGHWGRRKALQALKYVEDGARSEPEAMLFMFLSLPHRLGGFALDGAVYNHQIWVRGRAFFADICFPEERVIVEYNSHAFHASQGEAKRIADLERKRLLEAAGWIVIIIETDDLYDLVNFRLKIREIARALGRRIRIRSSRFQTLFSRLRDLLPRRTDTRTIGSWRRQNQAEITEFCQAFRVPRPRPVNTLGYRVRLSRTRAP